MSSVFSPPKHLVLVFVYLFDIPFFPRFEFRIRVSLCVVGFFERTKIVFRCHFLFVFGIEDIVVRVEKEVEDALHRFGEGK